MDQRGRTAYHEAGHVAACVEFQFCVAYCTISRDGDDLGLTSFSILPEYQNRDNLLIEILAGYASAVRFDPESEPEARFEARHDFGRAKEIMEQSEDETPWISKAQQLIDRNHEFVARIVRGLLEYETLFTEDIDDLMMGRALDERRHK
jgi:ATP-dependent Zn protease